MKKLIIIFFVISIFSSIFYSQDCNDHNYYKWTSCNKTLKRSYKIYMQPKRTNIDLNDTLTYNIVFNSNSDYIISFCADQIYYPINIKLFQPESKKELYDNATDDYCTSIGVGFYNTQNVILEVTFLADRLGNSRKERNENVCVGMILQWKKIFKNM